MSQKYYYITTTIPYVNADPHLGFALEIVQADCLARFHRLLGDSVFHNFGTDEHGIKIYSKALEQGRDPKEYVDEYADRFKGLKNALNLDYDAFIRTTDAKHVQAAQEFWKICDKNGDIYKKNYKTKYCVGCEMEKTDSELVDGFCEFHPGKHLEIIEEENYFFRFSKYQSLLLKFYQNNPDFIIPGNRLKEIETFVKNGLSDFSISRLKSKLPWGVPVPGDENHVMYVWFDALVNYISTLGWPSKSIEFENFWPGVQIAGKDNLRQQSAMWQAMLFSAKISNSKQIFIHGFIVSNGQRMSKTLGNVINPYDLTEKYGTDALRYYLLAKTNPREDSDFTPDKFNDAYQADLANGLGNLVSRVAKMAEGGDWPKPDEKFEIDQQIQKHLDLFEFDKAMEVIWQQIKETDLLINQGEVWKLKGSEKQNALTKLIGQIRRIAFNLKPFLPQTAERIESQFKGPTIISDSPMFPRLD